MDAKVGGEFELYGGMIQGKILDLVTSQTVFYPSGKRQENQMELEIQQLEELQCCRYYF